MAEHTPGPWRFWATKQGAGPSQRWSITDDPQIVRAERTLVGSAQGRANAEFIVRACNSHDELLVVCEKAVEDCTLCGGTDRFLVGVGPSAHFETGCIKCAGLRAAIAKAKGI